MFESMRIFVRQRMCRLSGGHDQLMHYDKNRLTLRCVTCQHETPGWTLDGPPPIITAAAPRLTLVSRSKMIA